MRDNGEALGFADWSLRDDAEVVLAAVRSGAGGLHGEGRCRRRVHAHVCGDCDHAVVDLGVEAYDGKFHDVDSDSVSFQLAAERACVDGFSKARPILLEPYVDVIIQVPERFTGDVAGSLSTNRGRLSGMEVEDGIQHIKAQCPFSAMLDYSTQLRSITAGEGTFSMQFSHYEPVPGNIQEAIVKANKSSDG